MNKNIYFICSLIIIYLTFCILINHYKLYLYCYYYILTILDPLSTDIGVTGVSMELRARLVTMEAR